MGHNVSNRKRYGVVMRSALADFVGWRLEMECGRPGCPTGRAYAVKDIADMYPGLTFSAAILRLRCSFCGKRPPDEVRLVPMTHADRRHGVVVLRGKGAL